MLWLQENREAIKRKHPGSSVAEVAKKAGEMWKTVTAEEKSVSTARVYRNLIVIVVCKKKVTKDFEVYWELVIDVENFRSQN